MIHDFILMQIVSMSGSPYEWIDLPHWQPPVLSLQVNLKQYPSFWVVVPLWLVLPVEIISQNLLR